MDREIRFILNGEGDAIAYTLFGRGPLLVVPPGWVSHVEQQWQLPGVSGFFERLARKHTLLIYDKHGTGLSDRNRKEFTLEKDVRDLEVLIDSRGAERFAIFGYSMGGPLAIAYAATHPGRIDKLILYGTFGDGTIVSKEEVRTSMISLVRANWGMGASLLSWLFVPHRTGDPEASEKVSAFQRKSADAKTAASLLELFHKIDVKPLLPRLDVPTLIIHRRGDRAVPAAHGQKLAAAIPGARFLLLEGDIHFPWLGDSDRILEAIGEFLGDAPELHTEAAIPEAPENGKSRRAHPEIFSAAESLEGRPGTAVVKGRGIVAHESSDDRRRKEGSAPYQFVYHDLLTLNPQIQQETSRVGIAQIHMDIALLEDKGNGLVGLRKAGLDTMRRRIDEMIDQAVRHRVHILIFPEMTVDLNFEALSRSILEAAKSFDMYLVPGAFHDLDTRRNVSRVIGPEGVLWEQDKHIPAMITLDGRKVREQIATRTPGRVVVANTRFGRVAVTICRDFLDMDLRVELKNFSPPVDIVINPAFTPVTQDFEAAHLEARRSVYAYFFFCNVAAFGNSLIHSPEKGRKKKTIPPKKEGLIFKDIDLFNLRSERRKWELLREEHVRFIQSTR